MSSEKLKTAFLKEAFIASPSRCIFLMKLFGITLAVLITNLVKLLEFTSKKGLMAVSLS